MWKLYNVEMYLGLIPTLLILAIVAGQTIKVPISPQIGLTLLDAIIVFLSLLILPQKIKPLNLTILQKSILGFLAVATLSLLLTPLQLSLTEFLQSLGYIVRLFFIFL